MRALMIASIDAGRHGATHGCNRTSSSGWVSDGLTPYREALAAMESRAAAIRAGTRPNAVAARASAAVYPPHQRRPANVHPQSSTVVEARARWARTPITAPANGSLVMIDLDARGRGHPPLRPLA